jgi:hypothetical protein
MGMGESRTITLHIGSRFERIGFEWICGAILRASMSERYRAGGRARDAESLLAGTESLLARIYARRFLSPKIYKKKTA